MRFHPFRHRPSSRADRPRPGEQPATASPRRAEPGSVLADEAEAFVNGSLAELRAAEGRPLAAWMILNRLCHGDPAELHHLVDDEMSEAPLPGVSSSYRGVWRRAQNTLALRMLRCVTDADGIRRIQHDVLIPLELQVISQSWNEPLTFGRVLADATEALDHYRLDH